jgi:hypothetical protein
VRANRLMSTLGQLKEINLDFLIDFIVGNCKENVENKDVT